MSLVNSEMSARVLSLLQPVSVEAPAGLFDIEAQTYQAIDQEMIKVGGLHQASIDWEFIEGESCAYLTGQCKQLRIVGHLLTAWLRLGQWPAWSDSLALLAGLVEHYWLSAYPKPGPTGLPAKRRQVQQMVERLSEALPGLVADSFSAQALRQAQGALARLQSCAALTQLPEEPLHALGQLLDKRGAQPEQTAASEQPGTLHELVQGSACKPAGLGNERETRRAALAMADLINQQDIYDPTGYQLRRFALWGHIHTAPSARRERLTELTAVPKDLVEGYQEALAGVAVEPALLLRIERSVAAAPFWIRGSYLASATAVRLAMEDVAAAIHLASVRFVRRVPGLMNLCFSDGSAFVDEQTRAWLTAARGPDAAGGAAQEYGVLREELVAQLGNEGVEVVLLRLQAMQAGHSAPRQRCHASVIAADLLGARGLSWLADDLYANAARLMAATSADAWEPDLYRRLVHGGHLGAAPSKKQ
ncbi:type VI secretion system protein TssA [Pseudomonas sp. HR96]|uniref:type VI secretion system protein TssA n=1 Tax=Pseudomonas sp. HR96 TaxID=1027966 RepID=UPI002A756310|nr:type VI secretion system protein TssA [Pseudomonas sp. HR96]WPO98781.1 type VI secretion system protein TssA [Pseudomonas sp. HR96]